MNDASRGDPINRLVALNRVYLTEKKEHCVDFKYKKMIKELQQTGWQSSVAGGGNNRTNLISIRYLKYF